MFSSILAACNYISTSVLGSTSSELQFVLLYMVLCALGCMSYYVTAIPSVFVVLNKMRKHSLMLEQMARFDMRAAKCF